MTTTTTPRPDPSRPLARRRRRVVGLAAVAAAAIAVASIAIAVDEPSAVAAAAARPEGPAAAAAAGHGNRVIDGLFDVGAHRLYLRCTGRHTPTVVMDASLGADSTTWSAVEASIARHTRVCVYDRAGLGRSDPGPVPRTSQMMIDDLTTLLRVAHVPGPYVVVGHSIAGFNVQLLAREDGGQNVVGVVLIDATPPGLIAVFDSMGAPIPAPDDAVENPEGIDLRVSAAQVLAAPQFPAIPLIVLTHGVPMEQPVEDLWQEMQLEVSQLSPAGRLVMARRSGHYIQTDQPKVVVRAIKKVVAEARHDVEAGAAGAAA